MHFFHRRVAPGHNVPDYGVQQCQGKFQLGQSVLLLSLLGVGILWYTLVLVSAKRKDKHTPWTSLQLLWDNDDVLMRTRAKSVTSLQPVWDEVQMRKPLLVSAEPWSPPLASCTNGISDDRKFKSASCVGASSIWNLCNLDISTAKFRTALLNPFFVDRFYIQTQKCISRHNATWLNCFCRMIFALLQISFKDYSYTRTKHWFSNIAS